MQHISQLQLPSTTPDTSSVVSLLGWMVSALLAGFGAYFWYQEKKATKRLQDEVDENAELRKEIRDLNDQRLQEANKRADDAKRIAGVLLRARDVMAQSERPPPMSQEDDWEVNTDVAEALIEQSIAQAPRAAPQPVPVLQRPQLPPRDVSRHARPRQQIVEQVAPRARMKSRHGEER